MAEAEDVVEERSRGQGCGGGRRYDDDDDGNDNDADDDDTTMSAMILKRLRPFAMILKRPWLSTSWTRSWSQSGSGSGSGVCRGGGGGRRKVIAAIPCDYIHDPTSSVERLNMFASGYVSVVDSSSTTTTTLQLDLQAAPHLKIPAGDYATQQRALLSPVPKPAGGLICLEFIDRVEVCNPGTGERVVVPKTDYLEGVGVRASLIDQWTSLCFDRVTNKHKLLNSVVNHKSGVIENRVFAWGSSSWRRIQDTPYPSTVTKYDSKVTSPRRSPYRNEVCVNGILYYLIHIPHSCRYLVKFHIHSESFFERVVLGCSSHAHWYTKLVEYFDRRLAVVDFPPFDTLNHGQKAANPIKGDDFFRIDISIFDDNGEPLQGKKSVALPPAEILPRYGHLSLGGSVHDGELLVFLWRMNNYCNLDSSSSSTMCFMYNARTESFTTITKLIVRPPHPHPMIEQAPFRYPLYCPVLNQVSLSDHDDDTETFISLSPSGFLSRQAD